MKIYGPVPMLWFFALSTCQVLQFPICKNVSSLQKRSISLTANNHKLYYQTKVSLGSPPVEVVMDIDTGSSDTWVSTDIFDSSRSHTWRDLNETFDIQYLDGSRAHGTYGTDTLTLAGAVLHNAQFGLVTSQSTHTPILGLGLKWAEIPALSGRGKVQPYENVPVMLRNQGLIQSASYSLWLNDFNNQNQDGVLLFGGIDYSKYEGALTILPIVSVSEAELGRGYHPTHFSRLAVILNAIAITNTQNHKYSIVTDAALPVVIDSGATYNLLPGPWVQALAASLEAKYDTNSMYYILAEYKDGFATFTFSGVDIDIPFSSFLVKAYYPDGSPVLVNGQQQWALGTSGGGQTLDIEGSDYYLLGDSFLSGAYVAYDLDRQEIGIAKAKKQDGSKADIRAIGSSGIPGTRAPITSQKASNAYRLSVARGF